jgi:aspartate kinase
MSTYIVLKFGGSSQCEIGISVILKKIKEYIEYGYKIILVISAVGKTTNNLYNIINFETDEYEIIYDIHKKYCENIGIEFSLIEPLLNELKICMEDYISKSFININQQKLKIISFGEYLASLIVHHILLKHNIYNNIINAHLFIKNSSSSEAIDSITLDINGKYYCDNNILSKLISQEGNIFVTQGFICTTSDNKYCVLTRSGSNTTASLIAASECILAERLEIWTDVNGLYTTDPRKVKEAKLIHNVKYKVAQESATMGSQLVHPLSIEPCELKSIPIYIKNIFNAECEGTIINCKDMYIENKVHLIVCQSNVTIFQIESLDMNEGSGFLSEIFNVFKEENINLNIVTTGQFLVTTTTNEKSEIKIKKAMYKLSKQYRVNIIPKCSIVSIIANNISDNEAILNIHMIINKFKKKFDKSPIYLIHQSPNDMALSYVVNEKIADEFTQILHNELI